MGYSYSIEKETVCIAEYFSVNFNDKNIVSYRIKIRLRYEKDC